MLGCECCAIAFCVGAGTAFLLTNRPGSPDRADHGAAGIAYAGCSAEATITSGVGRPVTAVWKLSTAAAIAYGSLPCTRPDLNPVGAGGFSPTRITWAPFESDSPGGLSRPSVPLVAPGTEPPSVRSNGAWSGSPASTAAATPACHWSL